MPILNLNNADALYYGNTLVEKLYKGDMQLYPQIPPDPYLSDVVLYLKFNDFPFIDFSANPKTIIINNNPIFVDSVKSNEPNSIGSAYFTGASSTPGLKVISNDLILGTEDFTIETWIYNLGAIWDNIDDFIYLSYGDINIRGRKSAWRVSPVGLGGATISNGWTNVAITRKNGIFRIFDNGVLKDARSITTNFTGDTISFNLSRNNTVFISAYFDYLRITKGVCRYEATYDPLDTLVTYHS